MRQVAEQSTSADIVFCTNDRRKPTAPDARATQVSVRAVLADAPYYNFSVQKGHSLQLLEVTQRLIGRDDATPDELVR